MIDGRSGHGRVFLDRALFFSVSYCHDRRHPYMFDGVFVFCRLSDGTGMGRKVIRRAYYLFFTVVLLAFGSVFAEDIRIVGSGGNHKISLSLAGFKVPAGDSGKLFKRTLRNDLKMSGWFNVIDKASTIVVAGRFSANGGKINVACDVRNAAMGKRYFSRGFTGKSSETRLLAHRVSDAIVYAVKGVPGIASSRIAMITSRGGKKDIVICGADGNDVVQLTRDGAPCLSPTWSPNGKMLYYTSFFKGFPDVYGIQLASGKRVRVASYPGINAGADISPDGRKMALTLSKDGNPELYVRDMRSGKLTRLTKTGTAAEASPSWSPDGRKIVFVSDASGSPQIYIISSTGGRPRRVTFRGNENVSPDWGQNGMIAYSSRRRGRYQVCVQDPDKRVEKQLTSDYVDHEQPSWAPDGRHIAYARTEGYVSDVYVLDTLGDAQVRLTRFKGDWYSPAWSPK